MKRVIISFLILGLSILFCFYSHSNIKKHSDNIISLLDECLTVIENTDNIRALNVAGELLDYWQNCKRTVKLLISSEICNEAEKELTALKLYITDNNVSEARQSISRCKTILNEIVEDEKLSSDTIL